MKKEITRRDFLKKSAGVAATLCLPAWAACTQDNVEAFLREHFLELSPQQLTKVLRRLEKENLKRFGKAGTIDATPAMKGVVFGYGLDISRCIGCRRCVHACVKENNQSRKPAIQWINVIEFNKESGIDFGEADPYYCSPGSIHNKAAGEKGSGSSTQELSKEQKAILQNPESQYPLYQINAEKPKTEAAGGCKVPRADHFYVPVACQQCKDPPCVKVCPVKATWMEPDGIVVIDYDWCIGCRYCMAACPYGARRFNWSEPELAAEEFNPDTHYLGNRPRRRGVVEKCTFCIQRTRKGLYPACVEICPVGARKFGNLLDPESEIRYIMKHKRVLILKNELATHPKFFYFYG
ncbi:MAG: 4Fe-4S dicluster domain-containing protein [Deltaproteobacteria bacterium]|nr:4Fe-4S dicluster domain-containing protein [Deltaproteobacteria bacterium]